MTPPRNSHYIESKVLTASQPALHLMLLEGALRFGRQALTSWDCDRTETNQLIARTMSIVKELIQSVSGGKEELSSQIEEQYVFIFRTLASARINRNKDELLLALDRLQYERETWKLVCDNLHLNGQDDPVPPAVMPQLDLPGVPESGLSLEA